MNNDDIILIDRYISGELSPQELSDLKRRISVDNEFNNLLSEEKRLRRGIEFAAIKNMALKLQEIESSFEDSAATAQGKQRQLFTFTPTFLKIAATVLLLIGLSYVIYQYSAGQDFNSQVAYSEYFAPYPNEVYALKRGGLTVQSDVEKAFYFYDKGDFAAAVQHFDQVAKKDDVVVFYEANALMSLDRIEDAKKMFETIVEKPDSVFVISSKWYLTLCYLKTNEISKAVDLLEEIKRTNNSYQEKAVKLLQEINSD